MTRAPRHPPPAGIEPSTPPSPGGSSILVVARETGLSMDLLRVWERRYGFPRPERRPGSNRRLYSSADVERLLAIRQVMELGYRVGDVIDKTLPELAALAGRGATPAPEVSPVGVVRARATHPRELVERLAKDEIALLEDDLRHAGATLGPRRFVTDVAHPLAVAVGDAWAAGELSIRHEKVATECLATRMHAMLAGYQDVAGSPLVLLATPPGEPHALGLQMVALYLVAAGAKPRLLGASTPTEEILDAARAFRAGVVGLTVTPAAEPVATKAELKRLRRRLDPSVHLWVGGSGAAALGALGPGVRLTTSWEAVDGALEAWRRGDRGPSS